MRQNFAEKWIGFAGLTLLDPSISNLPYTPKRLLLLVLMEELDDSELF